MAYLLRPTPLGIVGARVRARSVTESHHRSALISTWPDIAADCDKFVQSLDVIKQLSGQLANYQLLHLSFSHKQIFMTSSSLITPTWFSSRFPDILFIIHWNRGKVFTNAYYIYRVSQKKQVFRINLAYFNLFSCSLTLNGFFWGQEIDWWWFHMPHMCPTCVRHMFLA